MSKELLEKFASKIAPYRNLCPKEFERLTDSEEDSD